MICLDITRDVMEMRSAGKPLIEVRRAIEAKYRSRGPATPTPLPRG